jgi:hypothetical protein
MKGGSVPPGALGARCQIWRLRRHSFHRKRFPLPFSPDQRYNFAVSASEIIKELPKLSEAGRRAIREGLLEMANQNSDVALCNQTALDGALMLDRMEDEDARRQSGLCTFVKNT